MNWWDWLSKILAAKMKKKLTLTINPILVDGVVDPTGGTCSPVPGVYTYYKGNVVNVLATPAEGYAFDCWTLNGVDSTENPIKITM